MKLFSGFVFKKVEMTGTGYLGLTIVEVECVIVVVVGLDAVQIQEDIVELLEEEEAGGHALPSGDRVTLTRAPCTVHIIYLGFFIFYFFSAMNPTS